MLQKKVLDTLNQQFNHELYSAYLYFAVAGYFEAHNLKGFAHWMTQQATEELHHVHRIFRYINDKRGRVEFRVIGTPPPDWKSHLAAVEEAYKHECVVSEQINECVAMAIAEKDYSTHTFLQWFVAEQVEEEATTDDLVQKLKMIGDNPSGLFLLDTELGRRAGAPKAEKAV
jgi:ferritin